MKNPVISRHRHGHGAAAVLALCGLLLFIASATHAATPAGFVIGNQAGATYLDGAGIQRGVSSNAVETRTQQVGGLTLNASAQRYSLPGETVYVPHIVTNVGNGIDRFSLSLTDLAADYSFASLALYADEDANGEPDTLTPITETARLDPGEAWTFIVALTLPGGANQDDDGVARITATSQFNGSVTAFNDDTVTATNTAIMQVTKELSSSSGAPGSSGYTVLLRFANRGQEIAENIVVRDPLPAGMNYVGNAEFSFNNLPLTDAGTDQQGTNPRIRYCAYDASCSGAPFDSNQVVFEIESLGAGQSGYVRFEVAIDAAAEGGQLVNTAYYRYNDSVTDIGEQETNRTPFNVVVTSAVSATGDTAPDAYPGNEVLFTNQITNNGNITESFDITLENSTFPAGTDFLLYHADGVTPLFNSNNFAAPDTGPLAPGETINVVLKALLPATIPLGAYSVDKRVSATSDNTITAIATDQVTVIDPGETVDLTNGAPAGDSACDALADQCGFGPGPEGAAQTTLTAAPGETVEFVLYVANTGTNEDSHNLSASDDVTFVNVALPSGWALSFIDDNNATVTNTGSIAPGGNKRIRARITLPPDAVAGTYDFYFMAQSPVYGALDIKREALVVTEIENLQLQPSHSGQAVPGSWATYIHTLRNDGNATETAIDLALADTRSTDGWASLVFEDSNDNGEFDPADQQVTSVATLAPGDEQLLFVRVFVPTSAAQGISNITTLTATYNAGASTLEVTDTTLANRFRVELVKEQALDADCSGEPDGGSAAYSAATFSARPGECIAYRLNAKNMAAETVYNTRVYDATPLFTVYAANQPATRCSVACAAVNEPAALVTGTIEFEIGTMVAGEEVQVFFNIMIENQ